MHGLPRFAVASINHKQVDRLYREQGLAVRRRKLVGVRTPQKAATQLHEIWRIDFVSDWRLKSLTVADDFSHEAVQIAVDFSISGQYVTRMLDQIAQFRGYPLAVTTSPHFQ